MSGKEASIDSRKTEEIRGLFVLGLLAVMAAVRIQKSTMPITVGQVSFDLIPWLDITISSWSLYAFFMVLGLSEDIIGKMFSEMFAQIAKLFLQLDFILLGITGLFLAFYAYPTRMPWLFYLIILILLGGFALSIREVLKKQLTLNFRRVMRMNFPLIALLGLVLCVSGILFLPDQFIQPSFILGAVLTVIYFVLKYRQIANTKRTPKSKKTA